MGFATVGYSGDTASGGHAYIQIITPDEISGSAEESTITLSKPEGIFERVCKKCSSPFDSLKKKAQICPECKRKRK